MRDIINDLNKAILADAKKTTGKLNLVNYLYASFGRNDSYAFRYFLCEILNMVNVIIQMVCSFLTFLTTVVANIEMI